MGDYVRYSAAALRADKTRYGYRASIVEVTADKTLEIHVLTDMFFDDRQQAIRASEVCLPFIFNTAYSCEDFATGHADILRLIRDKVLS